MSKVSPADGSYHRSLVKFLLISALSLFIGALHGMLQVLPPIRAWLDSIGSPFGGPGHMIDPLAHAHINLVGGVVMLVMGVTYYLLPILSGRAIYSLRLLRHSFWLMTLVLSLAWRLAESSVLTLLLRYPKSTIRGRDGRAMRKKVAQFQPMP